MNSLPAVARFRGRLGLTQEELAVRAGVNTRTIQNLEAGRTVPTVAVVGKVARALGMDFDELWAALDHEVAS